MITDKFSSFTFNSGITLSIVQSRIKKPHKFDLASRPDLVEFCFFKSAYIEFFLTENETSLIAAPMQSHLVINKGAKGRVHYCSDTPLVSISITVPEDVLANLAQYPVKTIAGKAQAGVTWSDSKLFFCHSGALTGQMQEVFKQLICWPFDNAGQVVYAQAKCMELIGLKLIQAASGGSPSGSRTTEKEKMLAGRAAAILLADLAQPPSLQEVAEQSGMSLSRLKKLFPIVYGTTPFGFLRHHRLTCAKDLIQMHGLNASEAAFKVGYSDLSPFHRAFVKEFGIRPGDCRPRS